MTITVYTKAGCPQCRATLRGLDRANITYENVDVTADTHALDTLRALGYRCAPVVVTEHDSWSGYRQDKIAQLANK